MPNPQVLLPLPKPVEAYTKVISEEVVLWHHDKHQAGYVNKLNEIEEKLSHALASDANANYSEFGELKRRHSFNHAGVLLHENYWLVFGKAEEGETDVETLEITNQIINDFGSIENWKADFIATGKSALGWVITIFDTLSERLMNVSVDMHNNGAYWDSQLIIACDVFEHAYYKDYGPDRATYLNKFVENIDWLAVEDIFIGDQVAFDECCDDECCDDECNDGECCGHCEKGKECCKTKSEQ